MLFDNKQNFLNLYFYSLIKGDCMITNMFTPTDYKNSGFDLVHRTWRKISVSTTVFDEDKFMHSFYRGYMNRLSIRISKRTTTVADPLIDVLLSSRVPSFTNYDINLIRFGHRLSMGSENIIGLLLEEYIHQNIIELGWSCCWGNSISSVDFCSSTGLLIQVKNKSNTENSSSNKIRMGTDIKKWYRMKASTGETCWDELNHTIGAKELLSEQKFREFVTLTVKKNPSLLYLDTQEFDLVFPNN